MAGYLARRIGESLLALWGVMTIVFFVTRILGDPTTLLLPMGATDAQVEALRRGFGLDLPLWQQYLDFLVRAVQGDFGRSYIYGQDAMTVVLQRMPATIMLASTAMAAGIVLGCAAGAIAAMRRGSVVELLVMTVALLGQATPVFWLGIMLILWFAVDLNWFPTGGYGGLSHLVLPALTLAVFVSAAIARLLRSSILDILREDYVRTARAKGLLPMTVFLWHIARNALIPVTTMTAILAGELLGGSVVTETVFAWPGVGRLIVQAIEGSDFPTIQACVFVVASVFILINFAVDLLYGVLDPRIRTQR